MPSGIQGRRRKRAKDRRREDEEGWEKERRGEIAGDEGEWRGGGGDSVERRPCGRTVLITTRPPIFFELKGAEVFARGYGG